MTDDEHEDGAEVLAAAEDVVVDEAHRLLLSDVAAHAARSRSLAVTTGFQASSRAWRASASRSARSRVSLPNTSACRRS